MEYTFICLFGFCLFRLIAIFHSTSSLTRTLVCTVVSILLTASYFLLHNSCTSWLSPKNSSHFYLPFFPSLHSLPPAHIRMYIFFFTYCVIFYNHDTSSILFFHTASSYATVPVLTSINLFLSNTPPFLPACRMLVSS